MDEKQIRELELDVARVMGWEDIRDEQSYSGPTGYDYYGHFPGKKTRNVVPRFARDADSILSALEWLRRHPGIDVLLDTPNDDMGRQFYTTPTGDLDFTPWFGETLGIALCRAIATIAIQPAEVSEHGKQS